MPLRPRAVLVYLLMIGGAVGLFLLIRQVGMGLTAPQPAHGTTTFGQGRLKQDLDTLLHVLLALAVIIVAARTLGACFRYLQQPPVMGEVIAGLLLGPSLLGRVHHGAASAYLFPDSIAPVLNILAQVGVLLYMFIVGLELDTSLIRRGRHTTIAISHASIVVPFVLGGALALLLYPRLSSADVPFTVFALFLGVSMSVTAFPVLARILTDRGMQRSHLGAIALSCAAVDDVTAWCLLALVVSVVQARAGGALATIGLALAYLVVALIVIRPVVVRLSRRVDAAGKLSQGVIAVTVIGILLSALATEYIGIHAIFGAFLLGALIPHDSLIARELTHRLEDLIVVLLLPAFFAFTGLHTQIGLIHGLDQWLLCLLVVAVACLGKFGGTLAAARLSGLSWQTSSALGILMNTRGLMELIVLNIGLDLRVLSPTLFTILVLMAVATTLMTTPLLHLVTTGTLIPGPRNSPGRDGEETPVGPASAPAITDK